jgi:hypothetical protein
VSDQEIGDHEIVFRRVPPKEPWFEPPDRVTTANFKLDRRRNSLGVSVYRKDVIRPEVVLAHADAIEGSFLTYATVGEIRSLKNGAGKELNLDVIAVDDADNPGHAEIRGPEPGKLAGAASKALRELFRRWDG